LLGEARLLRRRELIASHIQLAGQPMLLSQTSPESVSSMASTLSVPG
jgi:hypothetical protein